MELVPESEGICLIISFPESPRAVCMLFVFMGKEYLSNIFSPVVIMFGKSVSEILPRGFLCIAARVTHCCMGNSLLHG